MLSKWRKIQEDQLPLEVSTVDAVTEQHVEEGVSPLETLPMIQLLPTPKANRHPSVDNAEFTQQATSERSQSCGATIGMSEPMGGPVNVDRTDGQSSRTPFDTSHHHREPIPGSILMRRSPTKTSIRASGSPSSSSEGNSCRLERPPELPNFNKSPTNMEELNILSETAHIDEGVCVDCDTHIMSPSTPDQNPETNNNPQRTKDDSSSGSKCSSMSQEKIIEDVRGHVANDTVRCIIVNMKERVYRLLQRTQPDTLNSPSYTTETSSHYTHSLHHPHHTLDRSYSSRTTPAISPSMMGKESNGLLNAPCVPSVEDRLRKRVIPSTEFNSGLEPVNYSLALPKTTTNRALSEPLPSRYRRACGPIRTVPYTTYPCGVSNSETTAVTSTAQSHDRRNAKRKAADFNAGEEERDFEDDRNNDGHRKRGKTASPDCIARRVRLPCIFYVGEPESYPHHKKYDHISQLLYV